MIKKDLPDLIEQMVDRGIKFTDAQREFERMFLVSTLTKTKFNVCKAARMTGLHRNTLSRKIVDHKIQKPARRAPSP